MEAGELRRFFQGEPPLYRVTPEMLARVAVCPIRVLLFSRMTQILWSNTAKGELVWHNSKHIIDQSVSKKYYNSWPGLGLGRQLWPGEPTSTTNGRRLWRRRWLIYRRWAWMG